MTDYEFMERVKLGATMNFDHYGRVATVVVVLERAEGKDDRMRAFSPDTPEAVGQTLNECRGVFAMTALVVEGYVVRLTPKNDIDVMPWEHPDRVESVLVTLYEKDAPKAHTLLTCPIVRPKGGEPFLGTWESMPVKEEPGQKKE